MVPCSFRNALHRRTHQIAYKRFCAYTFLFGYGFYFYFFLFLGPRVCIIHTHLTYTERSIVGTDFSSQRRKHFFSPRRRALVKNPLIMNERNRVQSSLGSFHRPLCPIRPTRRSSVHPFYRKIKT